MQEKTEEMTVLNFRVPISVKKMLEAYAKQNGYSISYLLRKVVEMEIISPDLPLQSQLWKDFLKWRGEIDQWKEMSTKILREMFEIFKEHRQNNIEANEAIINFSQKVLDWMAKTDSQIQTLNVQIEVLFRILEKLTGQPIRQILNETVEEWKAKKKKETEKEKTSHV
jgi:hypothetical protein